MQSHRSILVLRFRKVHRFIDLSPRLIDVRGRNAFLCIARKLLCGVIEAFARSRGFDARVLRCGGNAIYVAVDGADRGFLKDLLDVAKCLVYVFMRFLEPMLIEIEARIGGEAIYREIVSDHGYLRPRLRLFIGKSVVDTYVTCYVCNRLDLGVDTHRDPVRGSSFVKHVVRDELVCCVNDLFFRLLGRVFTDPGMVTIFLDSVRSPEDVFPSSARVGMDHDVVAIDDPDVVSIDAEIDVGLSKRCSVRFVATFFRHGDGVEDSVVMDLVLRGPCSIATCRAIVLGLPSAIARDLARELSIAHEKLRKGLNAVGIESRSVSEVSKLWSVLDEAFEDVADSLLRAFERVVNVLQGARSGRMTYLRRLAHLDNVGPWLRSARVCVYPAICPRRECACIDPELSYPNLDGSTAYDLEAVAARGAAIAFLRCDGDRFGKVTDINELAKVFESVDPDVVQRMRMFMDAHGGDASIVWDSVVERGLCRVVRRLVPILFRGRGLYPLTIYVGGDENLAIFPATRENLRELFNAIKVFRSLLLLSVASSIASEFRTSIEKAMDVLIENRMATLSGAIVFTRAKVPAYFIQLFANEGVELSKLSGRDALTLLTIVSVDIDDPESHGVWRSVPLAAPLPLAPVPGVGDCTSLLLRVGRHLVTRFNLSDVVMSALSYCSLSRLSIDRCIDVVESCLHAVDRGLDDLQKCMVATSVPRPRYGAIELVRYVERGVGL